MKGSMSLARRSLPRLYLKHRSENNLKNIFKKKLKAEKEAAEKAKETEKSSTTSDSESKENREPSGKKDKPLIPNPEIDSLDDKPWQKPGADLSDYFNYGFLLIKKLKNNIFK